MKMVVVAVSRFLGALVLGVPTATASSPPPKSATAPTHFDVKPHSIYYRYKVVNKRVNRNVRGSKKVASSLSISSARSVSTSVSCTSPKLKKGQSWRAKPYGSRGTYTIRRRVYDSEVLYELGKKTSAKKSAFNPYSSKIYCY